MLISLEGISDGPGRRRYSVEIASGDHVAIVGQRGSGKTALIEMLAGRRKPINGKHLLSATISTPKILRGWNRATPQAIAALSHKVGGLEVVSEALGALGLWDDRKKPFSALDEKQRQACALIPVVLGDAQIALIDETLDKLDPWAVKSLIRLLIQLKPAVVVATNSLTIAEELGKLIVMKQGRMVFHGTTTQLIEQSGLVQIEFEKPDGSSASALVDPVRVDIQQKGHAIRTAVRAGQESEVSMLLKGYGTLCASLTRQPTLFEALDAL